MTPSPTNTTKAKGKSKEKKEKVFHPQSRKAGQLERAQLRKAKLASQASKRSKKESSKIDKFVFFYHAIPPEATAISLSELHELVRDVWLKRHDYELGEERSARRGGRPKSTKQMALEEMMLREADEYKTGLEIPDLTHAPTVALFRRWGQTDVGFLDLLRFIRISSENLDTAVISRPGKHESLTRVRDVEMGGPDELQPSREISQGFPETHRCASTMQTMDNGPPAHPTD